MIIYYPRTFFAKSIGIERSQRWSGLYCPLHGSNSIQEPRTRAPRCDELFQSEQTTLWLIRESVSRRTSRLDAFIWRTRGRVREAWVSGEIWKMPLRLYLLFSRSSDLSDLHQSPRIFSFTFLLEACVHHERLSEGWMPGFFLRQTREVKREIWWKFDVDGDQEDALEGAIYNSRHIYQRHKKLIFLNKFFFSLPKVTIFCH